MSECDFEEMLCRTAKIRGLWNTAGFIYICFFFLFNELNFNFYFHPDVLVACAEHGAQQRQPVRSGPHAGGSQQNQAEAATVIITTSRAGSSNIAASAAC